MRVPYSWLRDVVRAGAPDWDVSVDELEQTLIRIGHEVEDVVPVGPVTGPLTVGRVAELEELTEFKKPIRACKVDVGEFIFDGHCAEWAGLDAQCAANALRVDDFD